MAAEEIVKLKVTTEGDQATLQSLTKIDQLIAKINGQKVNISFAQGMNEAAAASQKAAEASAKEISARARLLKAENEITVAREKSYQAAQRTAQAQEKTSQIQEKQTLEAMRAQWQEQQRLRQGYVLIGAIILRQITRNISAATGELKAMNAEMVSIQKVTEATDAEMGRLKDNAFEVAGAMGSTPSDYLSSVTKWAQAGYKGLSEQLGELSAKTQVVGDVNEETANKFLLAVDAAYKYKGNIDALTRVLDGANEISNNYATSVEKLAGGMGIVSSLAEQAGMKVEETMAAIGTITAKTQESGNSAARALRALILNIQGSTEIEIDAETGERWTEDEIQRTAAALGNLNVATREYKNGIMELRNPMEVIGELSEKYQKGLVTEAQLQEVVASLGGKVRSNQLMALIQGYDTYVSMIETYKDAVGSADKELDIYLAGWEAKSNKLVTQWTQFVESFKASDISMGLLDVGNFFLKLANTDLGNTVTQMMALGGTLTLVVGGFQGMKNETKVGTEVFKLFSTAAEKTAKASKDAGGGVAGLTAGLKSLVATPVGKIGLIVVGLTALSAAYDAVARQGAKAAEKLTDARAEYEESSAKLESLHEELKTTQDRIDELNGKGSLMTVVEREELDKLKQQNTDLERQITIQEKLNKAKKEALNLAAQEALDAGYSGADMGFWESFLSATSTDPAQAIKNHLNGTGFKEGAEWLGRELDRLNKQKDRFLESHPDGATWTEAERKEFEELEGTISTYQQSAAGFYQEMQSNIQNLADEDLRTQWDAVGEALYAAMFPAEALTEKFNRLADAMDEAEQTRFHEELERIRADGKVTAQEVQTLIDKFPALKPVLEGNAGALDILAQHLTETASASQEAENGIDGVGNAAENTEGDIDTLATTLKTAVSGMEAVKNAQEELKENGQLSTNTLISLLGKYSDAVNDVLLKAVAGLATQEEISQALEQAYQEDLNNYRNAMLEKEMDNEDFYASWLAGNAETVKKLSAQYGIDFTAFKTWGQMKKAIEEGVKTGTIRVVSDTNKDRNSLYQADVANFQAAENEKVRIAAGTAAKIAGMKNYAAGALGDTSAAGQLLKDQAAMANRKTQAEAGLDALMKQLMDTLSKPVTTEKGSSGSKGSSSSAKDWYETQIDNLKKLEDQTKRTNQVLERSDEDTAQKRIDNLKQVQEQILAAQKQFISRGKDAASDEVNQLKIMYEELGDDIRGIWSSMSENILAEHDDLIWQFDLKANNQRTVDQIAADDAAMVESYRKMQQDVHKLAEYYRSQGVRENDKLIQDLQDKWWEYEKAIRSMYSNLIDAFNDYIDESSHKIEELGRATGNVGKQIEIYAQRIQKAQETITALQKNNVGGGNNGDIFDLESQIWGDKDAIRDLQDGLWQELEDAFDDIFDKAQEDIDAIVNEIESIQDQMDDINDVLSQYDKELAGILKPINDTLEKLNEQLDAEKKRLEELTRPLSDRRQDLEDQIKGYYILNPDGSMGPYIKGLDDSIDEIQDQIDKANEELDRVNEAWNEQKNREEEALALQKKQLAVEEAQKAVEDAMLALQTARNERNAYTLKDGVWAWRADEEAVAKAEKALAEAEKAKEEAEKDLQDYKEEQAHKQIVKRLEEQIKALEEQKKLLDKQKDLINKQIEALNKQITAYERESSARQELIQDLIDRNEKEKEAWEDHYEALKEQYSQQLEYLEAEKKAAEERRKEAQKQYDQWMDTWKDIQKSIETPARDISEILNDIARYGTPAMAGQVDRVTELLRDLGYVLEDVTSGGGYDPDNGGNSGEEEGMSRREIIDRMLANSRAYQGSSKAEQERLYQENQQLGAQIGAVWDPDTSTWDIFDYSGGTVTVRPGAYDGYSGYSSQPLTVYSLGDDDGWEETKARYGILSTSDYTASPTAYSYASSGDTIYNDDHSITINGMKVGSDMMQRPLSDIFRLFPLYLGS